MTKIRLDKLLVQRGLVATRSQAESYIRLGQVKVGQEVINKPGFFAEEDARVSLAAVEQYVSRAGLKLASVAKILKLNFKDAVVLDVGSSTGGFTDYALRHGARKVIAVDVGTDQLHPSLHGHPRIELHEQTDIRDVPELSDRPDIVVIDVSFISLREILPAVARLCVIGATSGKDASGPQGARSAAGTPGNRPVLVIAMVKPQFEAGNQLKHKGVIKNDRIRREILRDFEQWVSGSFVVRDKADSDVAGAKGNRERFYALVPLKGQKTLQ